MSEVMADRDRAAAAYWLAVARRSADPAKAIQRAQHYLAEARAEGRVTGPIPTLDNAEAPPTLRPRM